MSGSGGTVSGPESWSGSGVGGICRGGVSGTQPSGGQPSGDQLSGRSVNVGRRATVGGVTGGSQRCIPAVGWRVQGLLNPARTVTVAIDDPTSETGENGGAEGVANQGYGDGDLGQRRTVV
ncbi:uncharacterized protein LOC127243326 [Andrographis paniculata]|uniref:uncharacterized protein LOC127243326 n=1 Tax=Andrographis paniculata TaxID=175694 RepID=UPI0021E84727|nr:uncharacterized protein LOC127243326 [Andrographis paniculata]